LGPRGHGVDHHIGARRIMAGACFIGGTSTLWATRCATQH
jgi:hypothetical protein